jgi:hypothetical protein
MPDGAGRRGGPDRGPDRDLGQLALGSLQRGAERLRAQEVRKRRHAGLGRLSEMDFTQPPPQPPTRLPPGLLPVLVFAALMLALMLASVAFRIR